jgi:putative ABC transport system permease protein
VNGLELLRLALSRLRRGRLRAALTMLGIVIGVASVVALVGVGRGTTANITSSLNALGTNLLTISPSGRNGASTTLTTADADAIAGVGGVAAVAPELQTSAVVGTSATNTTTTSIIGTSADYAYVRAYSVWQGAFLSPATTAGSLRVAVLGATVATDLGLGADAIGTTLSVDGLPFEIMGILQPKGGSGFADPDNEILVPLGAVRKYFVGGDSVRTIGVSVDSASDMSSTRDAIAQLLRVRHGITSTGTDDFSIFDQSQLLSVTDAISGTLTLLLGGIASIALVVGGIGIMNIMLVSVRERTREIGIRKAPRRPRHRHPPAVPHRGPHALAHRRLRRRPRGDGRLGGDRPRCGLGVHLRPLDDRDRHALQRHGRHRLRGLACPPGRPSRSSRSPSVRVKEPA